MRVFAIGQNTNALMGAIVRLDVDGGSPYGISAGNPFEASPVCTGGLWHESVPRDLRMGTHEPMAIQLRLSQCKTLGSGRRPWYMGGG